VQLNYDLQPATHQDQACCYRTKGESPSFSSYNTSRGPLKRTPEKTSVPCYAHKVVFKTLGLLNASINRFIAKADQKSAHPDNIYLLEHGTVCQSSRMGFSPAYGYGSPSHAHNQQKTASSSNGT
jgi:hypothetical protein